jgi:IS5 family transposase
MRPRKSDADGSGDLFRARLDQIINMQHELVRLADRIDWGWIDDQVANCFSAEGRPGGSVQNLSHILFGLVADPVRRSFFAA